MIDWVLILTINIGSTLTAQPFAHYKTQQECLIAGTSLGTAIQNANSYQNAIVSDYCIKEDKS